MWDRAKKKELGYTHPKTRVWTDADGNVIREVLHKQDWIKRKWELWERSGGRCEYEAPWKVWPWGGPALERCTQEGVIPAHVIPRHPLRNDQLTNLKCYCLYHDRLTEKQSWRKTRFGERAA